MAIGYRNAVATHVAAGNLSINIPSGTQLNDVAILFVDGMNNTASYTTPSGWTLIGTAVGSANIKSVAYYRVLGAGESGTTVTVINDSGVIRIVGEMIVYSGVDTTAVVQVSQNATSTTSGTTKTVPTVSATAVGLLVEHVADRANPVGTNWTAPSGVTERSDDRSAAASAVNVSAATGDIVVSAAGSVGGAVWTTDVSTNSSAMWSVVLNQSGAGSSYSVEEDFQSGSVGVNVTNLNSNFSATDYSVSAAVFSNTQHIKNSQSAVITLGGSTARAALRYNPPQAQTIVYMRWYQYVDTHTTDTLIGYARHSTTFISQLRINTDRTIRIYDNGTATATSSAKITLKQWLRFEWQINTTAGTQALRVFAGNHVNSNSIGDALLTLSGTVATTNTVDNIAVGVIAGSTNYSAYYDAFASRDSDWLGADPAADTPPVFIIASAVGVSGVWRPIVNIAVGTGGVWRPLTKIGFGVGGVWRPVPDHVVIGPGTNPLPLFVSPSQTAGQTYADALEDRFTAGWGSAVFDYWGGEMAFDDPWPTMPARHPAGLPVLASPKGTDATAVNTFFASVPTNWAQKMIVCYWQEPEDDFVDDSQVATFRASVHTLAGLVRPYGARNGVHLQEWTLNTALNHQDWAGPTKLARFVQNPADLDYISWSLYAAKGKSMVPNVTRIFDFMTTYCAGIPWGVTAAGSPVLDSDPLGGAARITRAQIVRDAADAIVAHGGQAFGWFDFDNYQGNGRDQLASKDSLLTDALLYAAGLLY